MSMALVYSELHRRYESLWGAKINTGVAGLPGEFAFAAVIPGSCVFAVTLCSSCWGYLSGDMTTCFQTAPLLGSSYPNVPFNKPFLIVSGS